MAGRLLKLILSRAAEVRNRSLDSVCQALSLEELLGEAAELEGFRKESPNLYQRVRALFFIHAIHRYHLSRLFQASGYQAAIREPGRELIPYAGYEHLLHRRFEEAIDTFLQSQNCFGPNDAISSALAVAYHHLGFQTLADQVRRSVRAVRGNQWMFRTGHPADHPLRVRPELLERGTEGMFPLLRERTPVRMDLSHSGWSDIFFLAMDYPEAARVLNVSINLGVHGREALPCPPVETYLRVIDEPVLRLASVDLGTAASIRDLSEVFDFARDYLGLLKAAVIASGIVPPGMEGSGASLEELLARVLLPGHGLEIVSSVNNIPKGSRLAVSTSLLASLISLCMRATGQTASLTGPLEERERRIVAARAILGEWLGGSGGGWQDSGGVWPGIKMICGVLARAEDLEYGISRGCLLPSHKILSETEASRQARQGLQQSLVLVHGGMAQNVGPILEMVTERYLLRTEPAWTARREASQILDSIVGLLGKGDIRGIAEATTRNFYDPIQTIIPWANNLYTETLVRKMRALFHSDFWGFWMLGGMSGGGMGFIFDPGRKTEAQARLLEVMRETKAELGQALPFAMDPVVYDFAINESGTSADMLEGAAALLPQAYYSLVMPPLLRMDARQLPSSRKAEFHWFGAACRKDPGYSGMMETLFDFMVPQMVLSRAQGQDLATLLDQLGFDQAQHEQIRSDMKRGRIGLAQNRLPASADIRDVEPDGLVDLSQAGHDGGGRDPRWSEYRECGESALASGQAAVLTLAAGIGSRWTQGAGVVKALHPFAKLAGRHRTFLEIHLAKSRKTARQFGVSLPHLISTSYLTHAPIEAFLKREQNYHYPGPLFLSPGRAVGLRLIPMARDLRFLWEETAQQQLDEQAQKVRESLHSALVKWALQAGEGNDYTDNLPLQCLHPVGHWFEVPNLLKNGVLLRLLERQPDLRHIMVHNVDTLGADLDPVVLGFHIASNSSLTFEVIHRRLEDRGGGLARVDGRIRFVEGLAMPHEEDEFKLSYYNSNTTWINLDRLLMAMSLTRRDLTQESRVNEAIRHLAVRMPSYVTLKEVKKRWGHGQEDIFPVAQFEKLWGDMSALPEMHCSFVLVSRMRGQQLKDVAQLDGWLRDGSAAYVEQLASEVNEG